MASFTGHDGSEPVFSSKSPDQGSTAEVSKGSSPATSDISAEKYVFSELVAGQPKEVRLMELPSIIPGRPPIFVNEKQYETILRRRAQRARKEGIQLNVKDCFPSGSTGHIIVTNDDQGRTNAGLSQAPSSIPDVKDFHEPFVDTNEDEEFIGEAAYKSIVNFEPPDITTMLRIMMGDKYETDISEEFKNLVSLDSPHPSILLVTMNDLSFDEAADDGFYDVEKMLLKLCGLWI